MLTFRAGESWTLLWSRAERERALAGRRLHLACLGAAVALGVAGQRCFSLEPPLVGPGLVLSLLGAVAFWLPRPRTEPTGARPLPLRPSRRGRARGDSRRVFALLGAVALTGFTLQLLAGPPDGDYNATLLVWASSLGLYLFAVSPRRGGAPPPSGIRGAAGAAPAWPSDLSARWARWWARNGLVASFVGPIFLVALALRVWGLGDVPPTLGGDEGSQGLEVRRVLSGAIRNPFGTGWLSVPTLSFYFNAPTIALSGSTMAALRLPWALVGAGTVLVVFWLVTRLKGPGLGLLTAALLATYHYHIHYSRLGSLQVADPLFVALALLFLYRGHNRHRPFDWALCGVVVGLAQFFYAGARFTAVIVVACTAVLLLRDRLAGRRPQVDGVLSLLGAALLTAAPMVQYIVRFPGEYNARLDDIGIFQSGWLLRETTIRHQPAWQILLDQVQRAALAFNAYPDRTSWYGSPRPLFDFVPAVLFLLGLGYATLRLADVRLFPLVAWWWGAVLLGGALTQNPPSSQRLITLAPPAVFFVALALYRAGRLLQRACGGWDDKRLAVPLLVAVLALGLGSVRWYFVEFTPLRRYGNPDAVVATALGHYANARLGPDWHLYFFGPPRMYVAFGSIPYLAPDVEGTDMVQPLTVPPPAALVRPDKHAAFVFLPERRGELDLVRQTFPGGDVETIPAPGGGDPLFILYRVRRPRPAS